MKPFSLQSQDESIQAVANVFGQSVVGAQPPSPFSARIEVQEDKCFGPGGWLDLGEVFLFPSNTERAEDVITPLTDAVQFGFYEWELPLYGKACDDAVILMPPKQGDRPEAIVKQKDKTRRALEAVSHAAARCGLVHPIFDAAAVAEMPFRRPTTIVADTSSVLQGGLDFVVRFLYPMARVKIPAIAHMEILNMSDRYMTQRRTAPEKLNKAAALLDHVTSQGGQRVLLRLELQTDAEIERPRLGADPLRGVVQPDNDQEDRNLGLHMIQRSFADRLILETAIQHRDRVSPDHPVMVLTSDQGLSRMTLAEGIQTLFFRPPSPEQVFGRRFPGTSFLPFVEKGSWDRLYTVPLVSLLWELAVTFGSARLRHQDTNAAFIVSAMGEQLSWQPFHSRDDLLWVARGGVHPPVASLGAAVPPPKRGPTKATPLPPTATAQLASPRRATGSYRFPLKSMLKLLSTLEQRGEISDRDGTRLVGLRTSKRYLDFRNFLLAGGFAARTRNGVEKTQELDHFMSAMRALNYSQIHDSLSRVLPYRQFVEELRIGQPKLRETIKSVGVSAVPTYLSLAEVACSALEVPKEGIYATPNRPLPSEFVPMAVDAYQQLRGTEDYVLTGRWLEQMVRSFGIHPIVARDRLNEAAAAGLLNRFTEGSTPETRFEAHKVLTIFAAKGEVTVEELNLYQGGFIIPGKSSVRIRIEEKRQ